MKRILSEKNMVVILFVMVLVTFSLAQEDTKKIERMFLETNSAGTTSLIKLKTLISKRNN